MVKLFRPTRKYFSKWNFKWPSKQSFLAHYKAINKGERKKLLYLLIYVYCKRFCERFYILLKPCYELNCSDSSNKAIYYKGYFWILRNNLTYKSKSDNVYSNITMYLFTTVLFCKGLQQSYSMSYFIYVTSLRLRVFLPFLLLPLLTWVIFMTYFLSLRINLW